MKISNYFIQKKLNIFLISLLLFWRIVASSISVRRSSKNQPQHLTNLALKASAFSLVEQFGKPQTKEEWFYALRKTFKKIEHLPEALQEPITHCFLVAAPWYNKKKLDISNNSIYLSLLYFNKFKGIFLWDDVEDADENCVVKCTPLEKIFEPRDLKTVEIFHSIQNHYSHNVLNYVWDFLFELDKFPLALYFREKSYYVQRVVLQSLIWSNVLQKKAIENFLDRKYEMNPPRILPLDERTQISIKNHKKIRDINKYICEIENSRNFIPEYIDTQNLLEFIMTEDASYFVNIFKYFFFEEIEDKFFKDQPLFFDDSTLKKQILNKTVQSSLITLTEFNRKLGTYYINLIVSSKFCPINEIEWIDLFFSTVVLPILFNKENCIDIKKIFLNFKYRFLSYIPLALLTLYNNAQQEKYDHTVFSHKQINRVVAYLLNFMKPIIDEKLYDCYFSFKDMDENFNKLFHDEEIDYSKLFELLVYFFHWRLARTIKLNDVDTDALIRSKNIIDKIKTLSKHLSVCSEIEIFMTKISLEINKRKLLWYSSLPPINKKTINDLKKDNF